MNIAAWMLFGIAVVAGLLAAGGAAIWCLFRESLDEANAGRLRRRLPLVNFSLDVARDGEPVEPRLPIEKKLTRPTSRGQRA